MVLLLLAGLLTLASGQLTRPCSLHSYSRPTSGPCSLASITVGSPQGTWAGRGVFAGGRALPASGRLLYRGQHCTVASAQQPFVVFATSIASTVCSLDLRIANAANNNASAILIFGDEEIESFQQVSQTYSSDVSVIFILKSQGLDILKLLGNSSSTYITIEELNQTNDLNQPKKYLVICGVFMSIIVFIGGCYGSWYYRDAIETIEHRNKRKFQAEEDFSIDATIDKIPSRTLLDNNEKVLEEYHTCAVCFENYKLSEIISSLPCSHVFHKHCVHPWLVERRSCPLCKMDVLKHYGLPAASSEESILNIPLDDVVSYLEGVSV